jgi:hypothetical protein
MSFGIELGILAAERDWVVRDARRVDACVERRDRRESMRVVSMRKESVDLP